MSCFRAFGLVEINVCKDLSELMLFNKQHILQPKTLFKKKKSTLY